LPTARQWLTAFHKITGHTLKEVSADVQKISVREKKSLGIVPLGNRRRFYGRTPCGKTPRLRLFFAPEAIFLLSVRPFDGIGQGLAGSRKQIGPLFPAYSGQPEFFLFLHVPSVFSLLFTFPAYCFSFLLFLIQNHFESFPLQIIRARRQLSAI
jgi:hypothetical protein